MSASTLDSTYVFDPELDHILTVLLGLNWAGPDNLLVEMLQYQGISSFSHFKVIRPSDFKMWSFLNPGDSITDQGPVPASISEGLADVLYYCQHLTTTNHTDRDTPLSWTYANFSLFSGVLFIGDDDDNAPLTASVTTTDADVLDQELDHILTFLLGLNISDDDDALVGNDDIDDIPSTTSVATMAASNHNDVTLDVNEISVTDDDDTSLTFLQQLQQQLMIIVLLFSLVMIEMHPFLISSNLM